MKRKRWSTQAKSRIFAAGICGECGMPIGMKKWDIDHIKPLSMGGLDEESNMRPVHRTCHRDKTAGEAPIRAKADRQRARHLGLKKSRSMRVWRKFNGEKVIAERER